MSSLIGLYPTKGYKLNGQEIKIDLPEQIYFELIRCSRLVRATKEEYLGFVLQYLGNIPRENYYQIIIAQALEIGLNQKITRELKVPGGIGRIDLKSDNFIIEVKFLTGWKSALGQILAYWSSLRLNPAILLLRSSDEQQQIKPETIINCCKLFGVQVFFLDVNNLEVDLKCLVEDIKIWCRRGKDGDKDFSKLD